MRAEDLFEAMEGIDEDLIDKTVPDRTYAYGGTGYGFPEGNGDSGLEYMQRLFNRNKKGKKK